MKEQNLETVHNAIVDMKRWLGERRAKGNEPNIEEAWLRVAQAFPLLSDFQKNYIFQRSTSTMPKRELIDITGQIIAETDLAIKLDDGTKEGWLPKSQIEIEEKAGGLVEVTMPVRLAEEKGFI